MIELLWLLLPVAAASGWWVAKREPTRQFDTRADNAEYFRGLNYLLDDKPDQAIEVFVRMANLDSDTAETHVVLGNLFRRRGEVDKAIHIHHNLLTGKALTSRQRSRAILELGEDYLRAGLFDRAETLFREIIEHTEYTAIALERLIHIYEQEKDWRQAIVHCDHFECTVGQSKKVETAHFFCECAEEARRQGSFEKAHDFLQRALERDPDCVRASIMQGQLAMAVADYECAIHAFQLVEKQDCSYFSEVIELLNECYTVLDRRWELLVYLRNVHEQYHSGRLIVAISKLMVNEQDREAALQFLEVELRNYPSFLGLHYFVGLKLADDPTSDCSALVAFYRTSTHMLENAAYYRCQHCGFTAKSLYWHCPSCKHWSTIRPLPDVICRNFV